MPCLGTTLNLTFNLINTLADYRHPANALFWITTHGPSTTLQGPGLLMLVGRPKLHGFTRLGYDARKLFFKIKSVSYRPVSDVVTRLEDPSFTPRLDIQLWSAVTLTATPFGFRPS